jgi:hypothetical protein
MLVPQFADHCFIDLFQGEQLIRRVQRHASDWVPPPGTWAKTGEPWLRRNASSSCWTSPLRQPLLPTLFA